MGTHSDVPDSLKGPLSSSADSGGGGLGCSLRACISPELPGAAGLAGPEVMSSEIEGLPA